jgi:hypothetical protein
MGGLRIFKVRGVDIRESVNAEACVWRETEGVQQTATRARSLMVHRSLAWLADHGGGNGDGHVRELWERTCMILDVGIHSFESAMFWIVNSAKHGKCVIDFGTVEQQWLKWAK